jgi:hypothetical protein
METKRAVTRNRRIAPICFLLSMLLTIAAHGLPPEGRRTAADTPRLWVRSLSGAADHIKLGRTVPGGDPSEQSLAVSSREWTEVVRSTAQEELRVGTGADLLTLYASSRFDITAAETGTGTALASAQEGGRVLKRGEQSSLALTRKRGPLPVALVFRAAKSSAELQLKADGKLLGFVNLTSEKAASLELDLRSLVDRRLAERPLEVNVRVLRGEASVSSRLGTFPPPLLLKAFGGNASFNHTANWQGTGNLYFYVTNAPPSTCGELDTYRNGSWLYVPNYVCTDATGSLTKGPWTWTNTPADQTDDPLFVRWPDGSVTPSIKHYWDKTCPQISRTSPSGAPPGTYYGTASDAQWGACFSASWGSYLYSMFYDQTSHLYWDPATRGYTSSSAVVVYGSLSGMPSCGVGWSTNFPALGAHSHGDSYLWTTCIVEEKNSNGTQEGCAACTNLTFPYP